MSVHHLLDRWSPPNLSWVHCLQAATPVADSGREDADLALLSQDGRLRVESLTHRCAVRTERRGEVSALEFAPSGNTFTQLISFLSHPGVLELRETSVMTSSDGLGCFLGMTLACGRRGFGREVVVCTTVENPARWEMYDIINRQLSSQGEGGSGLWAGIMISCGSEREVEFVMIPDSDRDIFHGEVVPLLETEYQMDGLGGQLRDMNPDEKVTVPLLETAEGRLIDMAENARRIAKVLALLDRERRSAGPGLERFLRLHGAAGSLMGGPSYFRWDWALASRGSEGKC